MDVKRGSKAQRCDRISQTDYLDQPESDLPGAGQLPTRDNTSPYSDPNLQSSVESRSFDSFGEPLANPLEQAAEAIHAQRQRLTELLQNIRAKHHEALSHLRRVEAELVENLEADLDLSDAPIDSSAESIRIVEKQERHQRLRQHQAYLAEKLIGLSGAARRLSAIIRQSQLNADYLLGENDGYGESLDRFSAFGELRALEIQEEERLRLAREIHDGPAQVLANGIFELEYCFRLLQKDPSRLEAELHRLGKDLREGLAEVRYFIFDLRPGPLAELGLVATIRRYVQSYSTRYNIPTALDIDDDLPRLPSTQELAIFRIIQEALQNTRKHSQAKNVRVALRLEGEVILAEIEDDGQGFEMEAISSSVTRHFGLLNIQERARLIRAEIKIESQPNKGTRISLRLPLSIEQDL